jgi:hypothetical protein
MVSCSGADDEVGGLRPILGKSWCQRRVTTTYCQTSRTRRSTGGMTGSRDRPHSDEARSVCSQRAWSGLNGGTASCFRRRVAGAPYKTPTKKVAIHGDSAATEAEFKRAEQSLQDAVAGFDEPVAAALP